MDRITRKELKSDKFALEVGHIVEYLGEHHKDAIRYGVVAVAVVLLVIAFIGYRRHQAAARQAALSAAVETRIARLGPPSDPAVRSFSSEQERTNAATKAFADLAAKYSGSDEATIAEYYLGTMAADQNKTLEAEKWLKDVAESGSASYASLAKLTLADLYKGQGKTQEAEKLLRSLIAKPSEFVSKEQATIALGELLISTNPAEARKLLEPLRIDRTAVSRVAISLLSSIPAAR